MTKRGDEIARPQPWTVRAADRRAGLGWDELLRQAPEAADRAWVSITGDPRRTDSRQHRLKGSLSTPVRRVATVPMTAIDHGPPSAPIPECADRSMAAEFAAARRA